MLGARTRGRTRTEIPVKSPEVFWLQKLSQTCGRSVRSGRTLASHMVGPSMLIPYHPAIQSQLMCYAVVNTWSRVSLTSSATLNPS
jgi:hypothetical protein